MRQSQILIVGAGAAGIAAGTRLMSKGIEDFVILEAELRIGGRIQTVDFENSIVDLGAQYCHGQQGNVVYEMANAFSLLESSKQRITNNVFVMSDGILLDSDVGEWLMAVCQNIMDDSLNNLKSSDKSLGDYVTSQFEKRISSEKAAVYNVKHELSQSFLDWFHRFENTVDGSDSWFDTSGVGNSEYKECKGNPTLSWKSSGYSRVLDIMMKKFPNPALLVPIEPKIHVGKEVLKIQWDDVKGGPATVLCSDGSKYCADKVLITVSLGVLKKYHLDLFEPNLPENKQVAIKGLAMGSVNKILLKFEEVWWPENLAGFNFIWSKADTEKFLDNCLNDIKRKWLLDLFGFHQYYGQSGVLFGWIAGESARIVEKCSDEEVIAGCQELLQRFLGSMYKIPPIKSLLRSRWYTNCHFKGSYSYRSMESERLGAKAVQLAEPILNSRGEEVLLFAGEATHEHFFSTVHGAIESGWREADRVAKTVSNTSSSDGA